MKTILNLTVLILIVLALVSLPAAADSYYLQVKAEVTFLIDKSEASEPLVTLPKGEAFYLSKKNYGKWRKALLQLGSEQRVGWILLSKLKGRVRQIAEPRLADDIEDEIEGYEPSGETPPPPTHRYFGQTGIGFALTSSHMTWGERSFETSDNVQWDIASATSNTYFSTVFADLTIGGNFSLRPYLNMRTSEFKGESSSDFLETQETSFRQTFRGLGLQGRFYFESKLWWWGLAIEGAQGRKLTVEFAGDQVKTRDEDLSFYILTYASLGRDYRLTKNWYFLPEIRAGAVSNQEPNIYLLEANLGFAYTL